MPRVGLRRRKKRTHRDEEVGDNLKKATPRSFVVKKGVTSHDTRGLIKDFRDVMSPYCAKSLKESRNTRIKDYLAVAAELGVTHLTTFSNTEKSTTMRVARFPQGPTLTFRVSKYSLSPDVQSQQKRPHRTVQDFQFPPLLVMNGMGGQEPETKLLAESLRNMFPPIDIDTFSTNNCRRVAMFHMEKNGTIQFRHFAITTKLHGVSRSIQKLINGKVKVDGTRDVADYILSGGYASDSEVEDAMPAKVLRKKSAENVGVNLVEIGPRMELVPVKAQEGILEGPVLFHKFIQMSPEQKEIADKKALERLADREAKDKALAKKASKDQYQAKKEAKQRKRKRMEEEEDNEEEGEERDTKKARYNSLFKKKTEDVFSTDTKADKTVDFGGPSGKTGGNKAKKKKKKTDTENKGQEKTNVPNVPGKDLGRRPRAKK